MAINFMQQIFQEKVFHCLICHRVITVYYEQAVIPS